jgi:copper resistance protein D
MIEVWVMALRGVQYAAAAALLGLPAFMLYSAGAVRGLALAWPRPLLAWSAAVMLAAAPIALVAQTALMAGAFEEALKPASLGFVIAMPLGMALAVRAAIAALLLILVLALKPRWTLWCIAALLGGLISATFAWTGHGAATEGDGRLLHLVSDIVHTLAASVWIGALVAFAGLAFWRPREADAHDRGLARALAGFAQVGTLAVGLLVVTGLVNSFFLVGVENALTLAGSPYGLLLIAKLVLFALMLGLAALNRFQLTPSLARAGDEGSSLTSIGELRLSIGVELAVGLTILALVAVMGTLAPPAAM